MPKATPVIAALAFLFTFVLTPICFAQTQLVGEWSGSISVGDQTERILWHVVKAADGSVTSTFDNVDEGVSGIKVKTLTVDGSDVTAVIDDVIHPNGQDLPLSGTYAGKLNADGNEVKGMWTQTKPEEHPPADITFKRVQATPAAAASPQIAGDWHGTLTPGGAELHVVFHFIGGANGALSGTLDSVDQGANGIPITSVTLNGSKLSLTMDAVHGTYEGALNPDATAVKGTWSQGMPLELDLERGAFKVAEAKPAAASDIDGNWQGTLDIGSQKLRVIYQITNTQDGLTARMQSPDQGGSWTSAYPMTRTGANVTIPIKAIGSTYDGKLSADLTSMDGTFEQGGQSFPLALKRVKE